MLPVLILAYICNKNFWKMPRRYMQKLQTK